MSEGLKQRTAKGLLWGAINNLTSQLLMALIGIILGRLLTPADYGMVGMLAIFSAIAGSLQESGFTAALTNLKEATHKEYNAVFWASTAISILLYMVLYLFPFSFTWYSICVHLLLPAISTNPSW